MEAQEILNLISKQWCTLEDLMALGEFCFIINILFRFVIKYVVRKYLKSI